MRPIRAALAAACLIAAGAVPVSALPVETTRALNLRVGPGTDTPTIAVMPPGEIVHIHTCMGDWCRVFYRGYPGWAYAQHLGRLPGRPFPWEGAERAAEVFPFDRDVTRGPGIGEMQIIEGRRETRAPRVIEAPREIEGPRERLAAIDPLRDAPLPPRRPEIVTPEPVVPEVVVPLDPPVAAPPETAAEIETPPAPVVERVTPDLPTPDLPPGRRVGPGGTGGFEAL